MLISLLLAFAPPQNLVVNGDFENNTSTGCDYNNPNATFDSKMYGCTAFGGRDEIDIMDSGCYGPGAPDGGTKIGIACNADPLVDALTMSLTGPLAVGQTYTLKVMLYAHIESWSPVQAPVEFGLATSAGTQGAVVATLTPPTAAFGQLTATFVATAAATHLSISVAPGYDGWTHVDGVELTGGFTLQKSGACPGPMSLTTSGGTAGGTVAIVHGLAGSWTKPGGLCAGLTLAIANPSLGAVLSANGSGQASLSFTAQPAWCGRTVQAVDVNACAASNSITL